MIKRLDQLLYRVPNGFPNQLLSRRVLSDRRALHANRFLWSAAAVSLLSMACAPGLTDYTQLTMQVVAPENGPENSPSADSLDKTQAILETRLHGLGIETAEIDTPAPNQIVVRLPQTVNAQAAESILTNPGQLHLRNQKPNTEDQLASNIEDLQRLLVEQNTLAQTGKRAEADALQGQIEETRSAISALFEPSELTGEMLADARAKPSSEDSNIWEVNIQFNEQGAAKFAEQTKHMAGTGRAIGLFLDDVLLSTPVVDVAHALKGITGGTAVISGNFTAVAAKELEVQLKSGALPVTLSTVEITSSAQKAAPNGQTNSQSTQASPTEDKSTDKSTSKGSAKNAPKNAPVEAANPQK
jgi:protein-export membrane protein SecD